MGHDDCPQSPKKSHNEQKQENTNLWLVISEFIHHNKRQMKRFVETIEKGQEVSQEETQIEKKKQLMKFISQKSKSPIKIQLDEGEDEQLKYQLKEMALREQQQSVTEKFLEMKETASKLQDSHAQ